MADDRAKDAGQESWTDVEDAPPEEFFTAPKTARARDFLGKILTH